MKCSKGNLSCVMDKIDKAGPLLQYLGERGTYWDDFSELNILYDFDLDLEDDQISIIIYII